MGNGKEYRDGKRDQILNELKESAVKQEETLRQIPPILAKTNEILERMEQNQSRMETSISGYDGKVMQVIRSKKGGLSFTTTEKVIGALVFLIIAIAAWITQIS